ncbi:pPIWI_RE module domain-containing protein [Laspinema palackyanum]|uniref:pPIWI_RE module domain-containing protein n=1 Tax=Laspinema palackyanum TaxID=3231601 RepID=UPI00345DD16C|nr:DUF3962 domain-containing protein [Laspinema sp. D2c]
MSYDQLRTLSFRLAEGQKSDFHSFYLLNFPESWKHELKKLQGELKNRPPDKVNLPITSLNKAMRALVPDLIYIEKNSGKLEVQRWLYSSRAIDPTALYLIIHAWVKTEFAKASDSRLQQILSQMRVEDLSWEQTTLDITQWTTAPNGTAQPGNQDSFILLPHVLAAKLSQDDVVIEFESEPLRFRRAPLSIGSQGAELVSWKPLEYKGCYWSVVITFTIQTVPFQNFPVLHCDLSLRRWVSLQKSYIPGGKETSVYLLTEVPWIDGLPYSNSFQVAPIGWKRVSASKRQEADCSKQLIWGSQLATLLDKLNPQHRFPDPAKILADPVSALNFSGSPSAAVTYRNDIKPEHRVNPGLNPGHRRLVAEQIAQLLGPQWEFVQAPERVKFSCKAPKIPILPKPTQDDSEIAETKLETLTKTQSLYRQALKNTLGDRLTVEIWYQEEATHNTLLQGIRYCLGIPDSVSFPYQFPESGFVLNLCSQRLGSLGDRLELDHQIKKQTEQLRKAIIKRGEEVGNKVSPASEITGAFIEIRPKDRFQNRNEDPKQALRRGFALVNRLTQFISTENPNLSQSVITAFLDLLRQLGVQIEPLTVEISIKKPKEQSRKEFTAHSKNNLIPETINYVGVWLIKHNSPTSADSSIQRVPVMIHMASNTNEIQVKAPGFDGWLLYRDALQQIARGEKVFGIARLEQAVPFIEQTLKCDILPLGDTLLLCHAQNLRSGWKWLQNGKITQDMVAFGIQKPLPIQRFKGLRIVRLRDSQAHETPEWFVAKENQEAGFTKGLFVMGERLFASTYNTPKQFPFNRNVFKPSTYYWNPGLLELTVACIQPDDEAFAWAALTHQLRHLALQFDEPLKLPLPLHLAMKIEEYVTLIDVEDEE